MAAHSTEGASEQGWGLEECETLETDRTEFQPLEHTQVIFPFCSIRICNIRMLTEISISISRTGLLRRLNKLIIFYMVDGRSSALMPLCDAMGNSEPRGCCLHHGKWWGRVERTQAEGTDRLKLASHVIGRSFNLLRSHYLPFPDGK